MATQITLPKGIKGTATLGPDQKTINYICYDPDMTTYAKFKEMKKILRCNNLKVQTTIGDFLIQCPKWMPVWVMYLIFSLGTWGLEDI